MSKFEKMEQALDEIGNACAWIAENCNDEQTAKYMLDLVEKVKAALEEPKRNCDVGTADEQKYRFKEYCDRHFDKIKHGCKECPARDYIKGWGVPYCQLRWAQMPYEAMKEGA